MYMYIIVYIYINIIIIYIYILLLLSLLLFIIVIIYLLLLLLIIVIIYLWINYKEQPIKQYKNQIPQVETAQLFHCHEQPKWVLKQAMNIWVRNGASHQLPFWRSNNCGWVDVYGFWWLNLLVSEWREPSINQATSGKRTSLMVEHPWKKHEDHHSNISEWDHENTKKKCSTVVLGLKGNMWKYV